MIAVDANVLVQARRTTAPHHGRALRLLRDLATGPTPWALPLPCLVEFLRVVTHRAFRPAVPMADAWHNIEALLASPAVLVLTPTPRHVALLREVSADAAASGDALYDAHVVALCLQHGVRELLTTDRGFRRFRGLKVTDPFA